MTNEEITFIRERLAAMEARIQSHADQLHQMVPVAERLGVLAAEQAHQGQSLENLDDDVQSIRQLLEDRDERTSQERKDVRVALIGLCGVLLAAIITGVVAIIIGAPG